MLGNELMSFAHERGNFSTRDINTTAAGCLAHSRQVRLYPSNLDV